MNQDNFEARLATLEFQKPVFRYGIDRYEGRDGYLEDAWFISNWDEILAIGNVIKLSNGWVFLIGHRCEMGGVGTNLTITDVNKIEGVAHISQLFKEKI